jgi:hypothetical protein
MTSIMTTMVSTLPPPGPNSVTTSGTLSSFTLPINSGGVTVSAGTVTAGPYTTAYASSSMMAVNGSNLVLSTEGTVLVRSKSGREVDLFKLADTVALMAERLLVIAPDINKHAEFSALKDAYDQYRVMLQLCDDKS